MAIGYTGGLITNGNYVHGYGGMMIGTPRVGASLMVNTKANISRGLNFSFSAGSVIGAQWSGKLDLRRPLSSLLNGSLMLGGATPGISASVVYVTPGFNIGDPCVQGPEKPGKF